MPRINKSQFAILGALSIRSMSAYGIKQHIKNTSSHFWFEGEAQLYPTLKRLAEEGLLSFVEEKAAKVGFKKVYSLTDKGLEALKTWLQTKTEHPPYRNETLLKLSFGAKQSVENNVRLLEQEKEYNQQIHDVLLELKEQIKQAPIADERRPYVNIVLNYGLVMTQCEIEWCDQSIALLKG